MYQSRFDKFVLALERSAHALWVGLLVTGVALGSAAVFVIFNGPDDKEGKAVWQSLQEAPRAINGVAPVGWTHICLGETGQDARDLIRAETDFPATACSGWNQSYFFFDTYASLSFLSPSGCHVIPINGEYFTPAEAGKSQCVAKRGLMFMELTGEGARQHLEVRRR